MWQFQIGDTTAFKAEHMSMPPEVSPMLAAQVAHKAI
jgi:hypothetical protein